MNLQCREGGQECALVSFRLTPSLEVMQGTVLTFTNSALEGQNTNINNMNRSTLRHRDCLASTARIPPRLRLVQHSSGETVTPSTPSSFSSFSSSSLRQQGQPHEATSSRGNVNVSGYPPEQRLNSCEEWGIQKSTVAQQDGHS